MSTASICPKVGHEFGSVTGRQRRCGWFDAVALRRSIVNSSCSSLCVTKLDVLDGLDTIRICVGYRIDGTLTTTPPLLCDQFGNCEAVYEDSPGWKESTIGKTPVRGVARECAQVSRAAAEAPRCPYRYDLDRAGPQPDHFPQAPFCMMRTP